MAPSNRTLAIVLSLELACAFAARAPLTKAPISTEWDYLLGQTVIASENWHRDGAIARHFVPSRSIDQILPEWPFRDRYWRDYLSQPPLAFMLHYWAAELFRSRDPVVVGKILAQIQLAAAVLIAAPPVFEAFGFGAALAGFSFLIWGQPFLAYFVDGYYSTTPAMLCHLAVVAWSVALLRRILCTDGPEPLVRRHELVLVGVLAFLGTFSEWVALVGNASIVLVFTLAGVSLGRSRRAVAAYTVSGVLLAASAAAEAATVVLFGSKVGLAFYRDQFLSRVDVRTQSASVESYATLLIRQMQTCWPAGVLVVLALFAVVVLTYAVVGLVANGRYTRRRDGLWLLLAMAIGFGGGAPYTYWLQNVVGGHWWFAGTMAVGWFVTICCFQYVVSRLVDAGRRSARQASLIYAIACSAVVLGVVAANLSFVRLRPYNERPSREMYRTIGRSLPNDGFPMIVADFPELFEIEYPFATAYLRRPLVHYREQSAASGPFAPRLIKIGTDEEATPDLINRYAYGDALVYIVYDESKRACAFDDVAFPATAGTAPVRVCRARLRALLQNIDRLWALHIAPTAVDVPARATRFSIVVSGPNSLVWAADGGGGFARLASEPTHVGPGLALFEVAANTGGERQTSVMVAGQRIPVTQRAAE